VDEIYVMGHNTPDMDAIGSAFGVAFLARQMNKPAYVILDTGQFIPDVERAVQELKKSPELFASIISAEMVKKQRVKNSLLIMVDHNNPQLTISPKCYQAFDKVVIIDHHRRSEAFPQNPLLSYIESGASSASELVTELIQYQSTSKRQRISHIEATLLLAGITVDTKSFSARTTSRTYDTASFLRAMGADNALVNSLLASDLDSYMQMNQLISSSEYITEDIVIAAGADSQVFGSVTTAKAADTILGMSGIHASFVLSLRPDGKVGISARSRSNINVQIIMEEMGGGGHFNNAAAQLSDVRVSAARETLKNVIQNNINEIYSNN
jgi:c-di-AMP phosphodiesterase-like protein